MSSLGLVVFVSSVSPTVKFSTSELHKVLQVLGRVEETSIGLK